jgi:replicative DNA helicase
MDKIKQRAERLVVSCVMSEPSSLHEIMGSVTHDMFEDAVCGTIFKSVVSLYSSQQVINLITVYQELKKSTSIYAKKAMEESSAIYSEFGYTEKQNLHSALVLLMAENIRHEHIDLSEKIMELSSSSSYDPKEVLDIIQKHIAENKFKSLLNKGDYSNEELLKKLDEKIAEALISDGVSGIRTGYRRFDYITSGMQPTNLIIVAARPAMGKTQFALGIMKTASINNDKKGLFVSCEMDEVQVMKRIIAMQGDIPGYSIKKGQLSNQESERYRVAKAQISKSNIKIIAGSFTITEILSIIYKMKYSEGLDYVVIDYIQKISAPGAQNRTNEVGEVSRRLKDIANELKIPIVALAQLSRAVEHRTDKKPVLSDLRESGDIEQDADIVAFLYRQGYYMSPEERENNTTADDGYVVIAKHRDGDLEDIYLKFDSDIPAWKNPNDKSVSEYESVTPSILSPNKDFGNELNNFWYEND